MSIIVINGDGSQSLLLLLLLLLGAWLGSLAT